MATEFSYNLAQPELPLRPQPVARAPYVNPGGNITLGEFNAGGARPNTYGLYDPRGAANLRTVLPVQANYLNNFPAPAPGSPADQIVRNPNFQPSDSMRGAFGQQPGYRPGQYTPPATVSPAAAPAPTGGNSALAVRPNAAPANVPPAAPAMKAADVLNVRTIPGTGGASAVPMLEAGGAGRAAGIGSKLLGAASTVGKALPFVGDVLQGAAYGMDPNSNASTMGRIGRGVVAGLGSLGGRLAGAAGGTLVAPGVGTAVGSVGGSIGGAAGAASLYDALTEPQTEPVNEAAEFQKRMDMRTGDSPEARAARAQETPAQRTERAEVARRETKANYPSLFPEKAAASKGEFQGPSAEEKARFRKQTGTPYDPKSITDKLNLERMRAGEQTFTSKQSREYRRANPSYRPGQYVKGR